jgi:hypothetical protein
MKLRSLRPTLAVAGNATLATIALVLLVFALTTALNGGIAELIAARDRVPIHEGDLCHRCQRLITDPSVAAEGIGFPGVGVRKFRNIACMLKYVNDTRERLDLLVTDHRSGRFMRPGWAAFVRTTIDPRTGEEGYVAFRERALAITYARRHGGTTLDWPAVQASERAHSLAQ